MFQIFSLGPTFYFMLSRKLCFENIQKVARFFIKNQDQGINTKSETAFPRDDC